MKFIEYYRVSTERQGRSGLGLEAQEAAVTRYIASVKGESINRYVEIESGGSKDKISIDQNLNTDVLLKRRPILLKAIKEAKETGATIIVKEASRLSRFSLLIDYLIASGINFLAADNPQDDAMFIKLRTIFNEEELKKVSERTKKALAAKKAQGHTLGKPENFSDEGRRKGAQRVKELSKNSELNRQVMKFIIADRKEEKSYKVIADELNSLGMKTPRGKSFQAGTVSVMLHRYEKEKREAKKK